MHEKDFDSSMNKCLPVFNHGNYSTLNMQTKKFYYFLGNVSNTFPLCAKLHIYCIQFSVMLDEYTDCLERHSLDIEWIRLIGGCSR